MNPITMRPGRIVSTGILAALLGCLGAGPALAQTAGVTYEGRAAAVIITESNSLPGGSLILCDTGPLSPGGGSLEASVSSVNEAGGGLLLDLGRATCLGEGPSTVSTTTMNNLRLIINAPTGGISTLNAEFVSGTARVDCGPDNMVAVSSAVDVQGVVLNGAAVTVTGEANQEVAFPGGRVVFNEVTSDVNGGTGEVVVVAMHVYVEGCMNGLFGFAHAGITCEGGAPPEGEGDCDKLTGGGWITGTPSGEKGTFGVSGGIRRGEFWGHLNYIDHGTGMHVRSTAVTGFSVDPVEPEHCRIITYDVLINDTPGTATVRVCDEGEPGRDDVFEITLSDGYMAGGTLGGGAPGSDDPGGGNIQLHKCPPGWAR